MGKMWAWGDAGVTVGKMLGKVRGTTQCNRNRPQRMMRAAPDW